MIVTVTANPSLDLTYELGDTALTDPSVEVHRARSASLEASGKGVNVSRALTRAGRPSPAVLLAGGATGHQLTELLAAEGVPTHVVPQAGATRVNTTVLTPGRSTTKVNAPGTPVDAADYDNLVIAVDSAMATESDEFGSWLLICGSLPPGVDADHLFGALVAAAHTRGWQVAVDSSGAGLSAGLTAGADLLAPNAAELEALRSGSPVTGPEAALTTATALARERGCELLVSLGPDGAVWTDGRRALHASGPVVVPVNTAGAGDALLAGWFHAPPGTDPTQRLATAVAWGTAACLAATTVAVGRPPPSTDHVQVVERFADPTGPVEPPL